MVPSHVVLTSGQSSLDLDDARSLNLIPSFPVDVFLHQQPPSAQDQCRGTRANPDEPLQSTELDPFYPLPKTGDLLFDSCLRLLDLQLLPLGLLPDPALLKIQIQSDARLSTPNLVAEARV